MRRLQARSALVRGTSEGLASLLAQDGWSPEQALLRARWLEARGRRQEAAESYRTPLAKLVLESRRRVA